MAFHESFWVVAGAAAPVIALAGIVSLGDALRGSFDEARALDSFFSLPPQLRPGGGYRSMDQMQVQRLIMPRRLASVAEYANLILQMVTLGLALVSLANCRDVAPLVIVVITTLAGLGLVFLSTVMVVIARSRQRELSDRQPDPASQPPGS